MKKFVVMTALILSFMQPNIAQAYTEVKIPVIMNGVNIYVNGVNARTPNFVYQGVTYIPLREISEMLNKDVKWDAATDTAYINDRDNSNLANFGSNNGSDNVSGNRIIDAQFDRVKIMVNGIPVNQSNILYNANTYVPLRAISNMLNKQVSWDEKTGIVLIEDLNYNGQPSSGGQAVVQGGQLDESVQLMYDLGKKTFDYLSEVNEAYKKLIDGFNYDKILVSRESWSYNGGRVSIGGYDYSGLNSYRTQPSQYQVYIFTPDFIREWSSYSETLSRKATELIGELTQKESKVASEYISTLKLAINQGRFKYTGADFTNIRYNATPNNTGSSGKYDNGRMETAIRNVQVAMEYYTSAVNQLESFKSQNYGKISESSIQLKLASGMSLSYPYYEEWEQPEINMDVETVDKVKVMYEIGTKIHDYLEEVNDAYASLVDDYNKTYKDNPDYDISKDTSFFRRHERVARRLGSELEDIFSLIRSYEKGNSQFSLTIDSKFLRTARDIVDFDIEYNFERALRSIEDGVKIKDNPYIYGERYNDMSAYSWLKYSIDEYSVLVRHFNDVINSSSGYLDYDIRNKKLPTSRIRIRF